MWNSSIKIDYIAGLIADALDNYSVNGVNASFTKVIAELKEHFPNCRDEEITDIINLCMQLYSAKKTERADLVLTAPDSFRVKALRTKETLQKLIESTEKSLTITGYSISDYFADMLDVIIRKSQQGVVGWRRIKAKELLQGPLAPRGNSVSILGRSQWASKHQPGLLGNCENGKTQV